MRERWRINVDDDAEAIFSAEGSFDGGLLLRIEVWGGVGSSVFSLYLDRYDPQKLAFCEVWMEEGPKEMVVKRRDEIMARPEEFLMELSL